MTRPYHSPSSIAMGDPEREGCEFAWAQCYIIGIRDPRVEYADIEACRVHVLPRDVIPKGPHECTPGQASTALGTAMHAVLESWYRGERPAWGTFPGRVAESGRHLLPPPGECGWLDPEGAIGDEPSGLDAAAIDGGAPPTCMVVHGVRFSGFRDLLAIVSPAACERLKLDAPGGYLLVDYKSTKSIAKWAKSPGALREDVAANAYALDAMRRFGIDAIACRWVYFETGKTRRAIAVDFVITRANALRVLKGQAALAKHLDTITLETATKNTLACGRFGGCSYHVTRGGNCDAHRSLGKLIQARKGPTKMGMSIEEMKAKFASGAATAPATTPAPPPDAAVAAPPPPPPPATPRPRAPRAPKPPPPAVEAPPAMTESPVTPKANLAAVLAMSDDMIAAQGTLEDAGARLDACVVVLDEAREAFEVASVAQVEAQAAVNALAAKIREALGS